MEQQRQQGQQEQQQGGPWQYEEMLSNAFQSSASFAGNQKTTQQSLQFKEFRPGQGLVSSSSSNVNVNYQGEGLESDLNVKAKEFKIGQIPRSVSAPNPTSTATTNYNNYYAAGANLNVNDNSDVDTAGIPSAHPLQDQQQQILPGHIEVQRNGETLQVPTEEAYLYDEDEAFYVVEEDGDGAQKRGIKWWAKGLSSIPIVEVASDHNRSKHMLGGPNAMCSYFRNLALEAMQEMEPDDPRHKAVPIAYGNAYCLENSCSATSSFGYPSSVFKVLSRDDGLIYCLRRFDNVKCVSNRIATQINERWSNFRHPCVAAFQKCFIAQRALFFVHEYYPGSKTLKEKYLTHNPMNSTQLIPEQVLWSYITQLSTAIRRVHSSGFACLSLQPNHILCTSGDRLRLSCVGIVDALEFEARKSVSELQREDM